MTFVYNQTETDSHTIAHMILSRTKMIAGARTCPLDISCFFYKGLIPEVNYFINQNEIQSRHNYRQVITNIILMKQDS